MKRAVNTVLCASLILGGCASMDKDQTKDIPKIVSVKDYDGKYIGEHKERNEIFLKNIKQKQRKNIKNM
ncbi:putative lipoprotein [Staphylococcus lugdunensis VCU150]|nr:putative lipoprotein [Staphylococcus lugdunensis VCU150]